MPKNSEIEKINRKKLQLLLDDLVTEVTHHFGDQIVSIVLFGSATTSEWIRGKSDIDCIVLIKNKERVNEVEDFLYDVLLKLDSVYDLKLSDTCTINKQNQNNAMKLVLRLEKFSMFGRPFYVVSEDQIDISKAEIISFDDWKIYLGTHVLASINLFFHRIKSTGKVLYGRDITKEFPTSISSLEKFKASFNALLLLMMSVVILPIDSKFAFQHAVKANFWACDNVLFALERPLSNSQEAIKEIKTIFSNTKEPEPNDFTVEENHLHLSMKYKLDLTDAALPRVFVLKYIFRTGAFISKLYLKTVQKVLFS